MQTMQFTFFKTTEIVKQNKTKTSKQTNKQQKTPKSLVFSVLTERMVHFSFQFAGIKSFLQEPGRYFVQSTENWVRDWEPHTAKLNPVKVIMLHSLEMIFTSLADTAMTPG